MSIVDWLNKVAFPLFVTFCIFAYIYVYRYGWYDVAGYGRDTLGLIAVSMGGVFSSALCALFGAGLWRVFRRHTPFVKVWLTVFFVSVILLSGSLLIVGERSVTGILAEDVNDLGMFSNLEDEN